MIMITFPSHKLAVNRPVALIMNEAVEGLNNRAEVEAFWNGIDAILALGRVVVVIQAYRYKGRQCATGAGGVVS